MRTLRGRQTFWRRMKAKIEEKHKKKKGEGIAELEKAKNFAGPDLNQNFFAEKVRMILVAKRPKLM